MRRVVAPQQSLTKNMHSTLPPRVRRTCRGEGAGRGRGGCWCQGTVARGGYALVGSQHKPDAEHQGFEDAHAARVGQARAAPGEAAA